MLQARKVCKAFNQKATACAIQSVPTAVRYHQAAVARAAERVYGKKGKFTKCLCFLFYWQWRHLIMVDTRMTTDKPSNGAKNWTGISKKVTTHNAWDTIKRKEKKKLLPRAHFNRTIAAPATKWDEVITLSFQVANKAKKKKAKKNKRWHGSRGLPLSCLLPIFPSPSKRVPSPVAHQDHDIQSLPGGLSGSWKKETENLSVFFCFALFWLFTRLRCTRHKAQLTQWKIGGSKSRVAPACR